MNINNFVYWVLITFASTLIVTVFLWFVAITNDVELARGSGVVLGKTEVVIKTNKEVKDTFDTLSTPKYFEPTILSIETIGIRNGQINPVSVTDEGAMEVPINPDYVGWYKAGPKVGEGGNLVLAGHYDWYYGQKGIFYDLSKLLVGDKVRIFDSVGRVHTYIVYETLYVKNQDEYAVKEAFRDTLNPELTLITCGGVWNSELETYDKRFLVKARLVE